QWPAVQIRMPTINEMLYPYIALYRLPTGETRRWRVELLHRQRAQVQAKRTAGAFVISGLHHAPVVRNMEHVAAWIIGFLNQISEIDLRLRFFGLRNPIR